MKMPTYDLERWSRSAQIAGAMAVAAILLSPMAHAQLQASDGKLTEVKPAAETYQTLYLAGPSDHNEAQDVQTDLRNMLPRAKVYYVPSQNAISIRGSAEDVQLAQKILSEVSRPKKIYRLTYTLTDVENGKKVGTQHFSLIVHPDQRTFLKQGTKVPIVTGSFDTQTGKDNSQVQYVDVGLAIEADIDGDRLHTKVEQSSLVDEKSGIGAQDPIIRQAVLEEMSSISQSKPVVLGSLDIPGGTRRQEIEVASELVQ